MKNNSHKHARARKVSLFLLATSCLCAPHVALAQDINPANAATQVYKAGNGVSVVDIAKANGAGLSHNKFNDYNVDPKGVVLNNGNYEQLMRQSKLAGAVGANMNLDREATVILNEVVTNRTSLLQGYTEVLGGRADVIVANPNGITCDGCGFINTPNATLTTGTPIIGGNGALNGFVVNGGAITVNGAGLDGREPDYLALVSRSVELDAQINAKVLDIVTGVNDFDYATKQATARAAATAAPLYAIDSSQLGGMYANRIRLIATEDGVGVKMLGDAAAGVGDFTLDAAGKIELSNAVSAKHYVKIATTESGSDAIKTTDAKLTAERDLTLQAQNGEVHLTGGTA
ncbi:MAG: filamentous hemagglutinin N-terminal domain-containing protein, partial [Alphaproteobacteria bacterium]|nr:filamentous hemagglutinin N-terminal domain-containing protein [Alphaproteobacteria bacterium]